jgi:NAD(P)-dependent dehydrogenase (short-subunit alcohol dehydrogenase family)
MRAQLLGQLGLKPDDLAGRVAVVTGAGQGIGKELAVALSMLGASVVIAELKETGAEVEAQIRTAGGRALFIKADISDENSVRQLFEQSVSAYGRVDILVNNAVAIALGAVLELPVSSWDRVLSVNLKGPVMLIKEFLPPMLERKDGMVINVLSSEGIAYLSPYSASKAALQSLTSSLVAELGENSGVSVFNFGPGMIETPTMTATVQKLAPRMGLTYEQFTHLGVNPGYDGLMPAEDCAAGFAHAIVHGKEYHGQTVDPFKPFIQAGLISGSRDMTQKQQASPPAEPETSTAISTTDDVIRLSRELRNVVAAVNKETDELDLFKKTWVKNDFSRKTGMSLKDWTAISVDLARDMEELARSGENGKAAVIKGKFPYYIARIEKLAAYFNAQAENAKGYFKDPEQRDTAIAALAQRESAALGMTKALRELSK